MADDFINVAAPQVGEEEAAAVRQVLLSGQYVSGEKVAEFERRFAEYVGVGYAVAVNSGTAALHIALEALGVGNGDEVIVPPLTFFATVSSVLFHRAVPVFADIDLDDLCLSPKSVEANISNRTKAILPVHLFGAPAKMDEFARISNDYHIPILEDCAQAHGTEYKGNKVGGLGAAGAFSFFATKHMTTGEGGMITTHDPQIAETAKIIRNHGMVGRDDHVRLGFNCRMTEIEAAMGLIQLEKLDRLNEKRIKNSADILEAAGKLPWANIPVPAIDGRHTFFWCPLMVRESSQKTIGSLKQHLLKHKIGFRQRYQEPLYRQPVIKNLGRDYTDLFLSNVESVAGNIIGLPNHPGLTQVELERIVAALYSF